MIKKVIIGILAGALIGMYINSFFAPDETTLKSLLLSKISVTSSFTGLLCGIYAHLSKSKLQVFLISILIGIVVFYTKYLVTGHNFDPLTMGAFTGALLGGVFAIVRKIMHSYKIYTRLKRLREKGFNNYS